MRRVSTIHIAALIASLVYATQARAFEAAPFEAAPFELPDGLFQLEAPCLPAECVGDVIAQYQSCIVWPLIDSDVEAANRCADRLNVDLDCCAGLARPGVFCR